MCKKLSKLFLKSSSSEDNDEINIIQNSSDESYDYASSSPRFIINVISTSQKIERNFLLDVLDKVEDPTIKKEVIARLKGLESNEPEISSSLPPTEPFSISKLFNKYPSNSFKNLEINNSPINQLQHEINSLKTQVNELKGQIQGIQINESDLNQRLLIIQQNEYKKEKSQKETLDEIAIEQNPVDNNNDSEFIKTIQKINFQRWNIIVTLKIKDFTQNFFALVDIGADQNCIKYEIIPKK